MTQQALEKIKQINKDFYKSEAVSFSQTRQNAWPGWNIFWQTIEDELTKQIDVLDIGCGNGRLADFLQQKIPDQFTYVGVDQEPELMSQTNLKSPAVKYYTEDLTKANWYDGLASNQYDLVTVLGVLHHIPSKILRQQLLRSAGQLLSDQGFLIVSWWNLFRDPRFERMKIPWQKVSIKTATVDANDYLIGWQNSHWPRYYHYADPAERTFLLKKTNLIKVKEYTADGKSGQLNSYTILKKESP